MRDTSASAAAIQAEIHERLGGAGRLSLALELSDLVRSLAAAGREVRPVTKAGGQGHEAARQSRP